MNGSPLSETSCCYKSDSVYATPVASSWLSTERLCHFAHLALAMSIMSKKTKLANNKIYQGVKEFHMLARIGSL